MHVGAHNRMQSRLLPLPSVGLARLDCRVLPHVPHVSSRHTFSPTQECCRKNLHLRRTTVSAGQDVSGIQIMPWTGDEKQVTVRDIPVEILQ